MYRSLLLLLPVILGGCFEINSRRSSNPPPVPSSQLCLQPGQSGTFTHTFACHVGALAENQTSCSYYVVGVGIGGAPNLAPVVLGDTVPGVPEGESRTITYTVQSGNSYGGYIQATQTNCNVSGGTCRPVSIQNVTVSPFCS